MKEIGAHYSLEHWPYDNALNTELHKGLKLLLILALQDQTVELKFGSRLRCEKTVFKLIHEVAYIHWQRDWVLFEHIEVVDKVLQNPPFFVGLIFQNK